MGLMAVAVPAGGPGRKPRQNDAVNSQKSAFLGPGTANNLALGKGDSVPKMTAAWAGFLGFAAIRAPQSQSVSHDIRATPRQVKA